MRRLLEAYALAARVPEPRGRALMEAAVQDVARGREQQRLGELRAQVQGRASELDARRGAAARLLGG
jgi:hypothetical protein